METVTLARFQEILDKYPSIKIGVLGDFCLDRYFVFDPDIEEISLETNRPCHRVIGRDGKLHGYGGGDGLPTKEWLLKLEGAVIT